MKKKVRLKKTVKRKFLLFVILAVIMTGLIVGELTIGQREVKDPAVERLEAKISETTTQEEPQEETTEEETTAETTAPEPVPETTASAPPVTASAADFNNPQTVDPSSGNWELTLVYAGHKLPDGYVPSLANAISGSSVQLDSRVVKAYQEMYDAAKKDGCVLTPYAGYCSVSRQNDNYNRKVSYYKNQGLSDGRRRRKGAHVYFAGRIFRAKSRSVNGYCECKLRFCLYKGVFVACKKCAVTALFCAIRK